MNNKLNNLLNEFLEQNQDLTEEELDQKLQEFIGDYNNDLLDYEVTPLDEAYEILDKAYEADSLKEATKLAKQALKKCDYCLDATIFLANLEKNTLKIEQIINEGIDKEKKRLTKEGFFEKDNIGHFYGIFETRPYIRGLYFKAQYLATLSRLKKAREVCLEILRLNSNDNMGARYLLMAVDAGLEDEKDLLKIYKKYPEENLRTLFPLCALYYKQENMEKAKEYASRLHKVNSNLLKFYQEKIEMDEYIEDGCYQIGDASEVVSYIEEQAFLLPTIIALRDFYIEKNKKSPKK